MALFTFLVIIHGLRGEFSVVIMHITKFPVKTGVARYNPRFSLAKRSGHTERKIMKKNHLRIIPVARSYEESS